MPNSWTVKGTIVSENWIQSNAGEFALISPAKIGITGYFTIKYVCNSIWPRYVILNVVPLI